MEIYSIQDSMGIIQSNIVKQSKTIIEHTGAEKNSPFHIYTHTVHTLCGGWDMAGSCQPSFRNRETGLVNLCSGVLVWHPAGRWG